MKFAPQVSVIMPTYNRAWCLDEAIESVMALESPALELLVVDDGSRDGTAALLAARQQRHGERLRVLRHADGGNRGIAASRNLAIAQARAPLLAFLDSDDWYLPQRFDCALQVLAERPQLDAVIEPYEIDNEGQRSLEWHLTRLPPDAEGAIAALPAMLEQQLGWTVPVITVRRAAIEALGGFQPRFAVAEDTALWLRLAATRRVGVAQSERPVARVRRHAAHSWSALDQERAWMVYLDVLIDTLRFAQVAQADADARRRLARRLRSYLIETLCLRAARRGTRLRAWWRSVCALPSLAFDRAVAANLARQWMP